MVKEGPTIPGGNFTIKSPANFSKLIAGPGYDLGVSFQYRLLNNGLSFNT